VNTECAYYPGCKKLVVINNSEKPEKTSVIDRAGKRYNFRLKPHGMKIADL